jgi:hypothetical protein
MLLLHGEHATRLAPKGGVVQVCQFCQYDSFVSRHVVQGRQRLAMLVSRKDSSDLWEARASRWTFWYRRSGSSRVTVCMFDPLIVSAQYPSITFSDYTLIWPVSQDGVIRSCS